MQRPSGRSGYLNRLSAAASVQSSPGVVPIPPRSSPSASSSPSSLNFNTSPSSSTTTLSPHHNNNNANPRLVPTPPPAPQSPTTDIQPPSPCVINFESEKNSNSSSIHLASSSSIPTTTTASSSSPPSSQTPPAASSSPPSSSSSRHPPTSSPPPSSSSAKKRATDSTAATTTRESNNGSVPIHNGNTSNNSDNNNFNDNFQQININISPSNSEKISSPVTERTSSLEKDAMPTTPRNNNNISNNGEDRVSSPTRSISSPLPAVEEEIDWLSFITIKDSNCLGRGAFGGVYHGIDNQSGASLAVKVVQCISLDEKAKRRLTREANIMRHSHHPNIVQCFGTQMKGSTFYIFQEFISGGSLAERIQNGLNEHLSKKFTFGILNGLVYLHAMEVIHRDIKPQNILIDPTGTVKLADFGISKYVDSQTVEQGIIGTVGYLSPEAAKNKAVCASDVWSLGCTTLHMLTGRQPWAGLEAMAIALKSFRNIPPEIPPTVSESARSFLENCFIIDPTLRPSAEKMQLHAFLASVADSILSRSSSGATHSTISDMGQEYAAAVAVREEKERKRKETAAAIAAAVDAVGGEVEELVKEVAAGDTCSSSASSAPLTNGSTGENKKRSSKSSSSQSRANHSGLNIPTPIQSAGESSTSNSSSSTSSSSTATASSATLNSTTNTCSSIEEDSQLLKDRSGSNGTLTDNDNSFLGTFASIERQRSKGSSVETIIINSNNGLHISALIAAPIALSSEPAVVGAYRTFSSERGGEEDCDFSPALTNPFWLHLDEEATATEEIFRKIGASLRFSIDVASGEPFLTSFANSKVLHLSGQNSPFGVILEDLKGGVSIQTPETLEQCWKGEHCPELVVLVGSAASKAADLMIGAGASQVLAISVEDGYLKKCAQAREFLRAFYNELLSNGHSAQQSFDKAKTLWMMQSHKSDSKCSFTMKTSDSQPTKKPITASIPSGDPIDVSPNRPPCYLPERPPVFVGREQELHSLIESVENSRVTLVTGPGGIGKSAIAICAGYFFHRRRTFQHGVFFVDQTGLSVEAVIFSIAKTLRCRVEKREDLFAKLSRMNALLILDKCERNDDEQQKEFVELITDICKVAPAVKLLLTSRLWLKMSNFSSSLQSTEMTQICLSSLSRESASHLLKLTESSITYADADAISDVCCNHPLALRMVGSSLLRQRGTLDKSDINKWSKTKNRFLALKKLCVDNQNDVIDGIIRSSYDSISKELQKSFRCFSIFPGSFTFKAACAVMHGENILESEGGEGGGVSNNNNNAESVGDEKLQEKLEEQLDQTRRCLLELVEYSLLELDRDSVRYYFHDLLKEWGAMHASKEDIHTITSRKIGFVHYVCQLLREANTLFLQQSKLDVFDADRHNIDFALKLASASDSCIDESLAAKLVMSCRMLLRLRIDNRTRFDLYIRFLRRFFPAETIAFLEERGALRLDSSPVRSGSGDGSVRRQASPPFRSSSSSSSSGAAASAGGPSPNNNKTPSSTPRPSPAANDEPSRVIIITDETKEHARLESILLAEIGFCHSDLRRYEIAMICFDRALQTQADYGLNGSIENAETLNFTGNCHNFCGRLQESERLLLRSLDIHVRLLGPDHPQTILVKNNVANAYSYWIEKDGAKWDLAERWHREVLQQRRIKLGDNHLDVSQSLHNLSQLLLRKGGGGEQLWDEAEDMLTRSWDIRERVLGRHHPLVAATIHALGNLYRLNRFEYDTAEHYFRSALKLRLEFFGKINGTVAESYAALGSVCLNQGRYVEAEPYLLESYNIYQSIQIKAYEMNALLCDIYEAVSKIPGRESDAQLWRERYAKHREGENAENRPLKLPHHLRRSLTFSDTIRVPRHPNLHKGALVGAGGRNVREIENQLLCSVSVEAEGNDYVFKIEAQSEKVLKEAKSACLALVDRLKRSFNRAYSTGSMSGFRGTPSDRGGGGGGGDRSAQSTPGGYRGGGGGGRERERRQFVLGDAINASNLKALSNRDAAGGGAAPGGGGVSAPSHHHHHHHHQNSTFPASSSSSGGGWGQQQQQQQQQEYQHNRDDFPSIGASSKNAARKRQVTTKPSDGVADESQSPPQPKLTPVAAAVAPSTSIVVGKGSSLAAARNENNNNNNPPSSSAWAAARGKN